MAGFACQRYEVGMLEAARVVDTVHAVVLAGRRNNGKLAAEPGQYEALVDIAGKPMAARVIDALIGARGIGTVVVVGPAEIGAAHERVSFVPPGETMLENVRLGAAALPEHGRVLVVTSDIPMLTPRAVEDFLEQAASRPEADAVYPVIPREAVQGLFSGMQRTYVRLKDVTVTGGNMMILSPALIGQLEDLAGRVVQLRKSPWRLAGMLGPGFVLRFLLHRVTLGEAERRVCRLFGLKGAAVVLPWPEVGADVDKPSDLSLCREVLAARVASS